VVLKAFRLAIFFLIIAMLVAFEAIRQATQSTPEFYAVAMKLEPENANKSGEELEEQVFAFRNEVKKPARWSLRLTDQQINGWLASDLEEKFPDLLPKEIKNPRVGILEKTFHAGCQYKGANLNSILAISLECYLVEGETNLVGIQFHRATAGTLPIPLAQVIDIIDEYAEKAEIPIRWQQRNNDPVALVTIPSQGEGIEGQIRVDMIELKAGEILLAGETIQPEAEPGD